MYEEAPPSPPSAPPPRLRSGLPTTTPPPLQPLSPPLWVASCQGESTLHTHLPLPGQLCSGCYLPGSTPLFYYGGGQETSTHLSLLQKKKTHNGLVCTVCAFRTQQIQQWWAGGGRLEGCRLHAMKLIDSCKNRGTQSSAKETQYHTARWACAPAFVRILLQSGICALPAAGEKKHGRVWEDVPVCMRKKYSGITSALSRESQMCSICESNLLVRDEMYLISIHSWVLKSQVQLF